MPDYNIYLRAIGGIGDNSSPTSPWQNRESGERGSSSSGDGFSPANTISRVGAFLTNPDSMIARVIHSGIGKLGLAAIGGMVAWNITDKALSTYYSFQSSLRGDYKGAIDYSNFKNQIHNMLHPISNNIQAWRNQLEIRKQNLAVEQQRLLLGDTMLNAPYGRYL